MTDRSPGPSWSNADLVHFGDADEIEISTRRGDGSLRAYVPIWIVTVTNGLYVRSYRGSNGAWYRHATQDPSGAIRADGRLADVTFTPAGEDVRPAVDAAYHAKYARYGDTYMHRMLADQAVATTLRIDPAS